jgi:hypothetical protein
MKDRLSLERLVGIAVDVEEVVYAEVSAGGVEFELGEMEGLVGITVRTNASVSVAVVLDVPNESIDTVAFITMEVNELELLLDTGLLDDPLEVVVELAVTAPPAPRMTDIVTAEADPVPTCFAGGLKGGLPVGAATAAVLVTLSVVTIRVLYTSSTPPSA